MKTKVVQVLIRRSETSDVADIVYTHEIPVIKVCRGAGAVQVTDTDCSNFDLKPFELRPRDELIRLKRKYKGFVVEGQHPVDVAFPDGSRDIELFYKDPSAFDQVGEEIPDEELFEDVDQGPEELEQEVEPEPGDMDEDPVIPQTFGPLDGLDVNDRPSVVAKLQELEVPFAATTPTKHLVTLLERSVEQGATD